jgi:hypothetical protein
MDHSAGAVPVALHRHGGSSEIRVAMQSHGHGTPGLTLGAMLWLSTGMWLSNLACSRKAVAMASKRRHYR